MSSIKFGDICREIKITTKDAIADGYQRYIGLEHLDSNSLKIKRWGNIAEDNPSFTRAFKKGHILFGKRRPYLRKAAVAEFDGICSGDIIVMEPKSDSVNKGLLPFIVQSDKFWNWAIKTSSGSLSPRTKYKNLAELVLNFEEEKKQESTLDILNKCQEVISYQDAAIESHEFLTKRIIDEKLKILSEKYLSKSFQQLIDSLDIFEIQDGNHGNDHPKASEYVESGIPFVMASDLTSGEIDIENCKFLTRQRTDSLRIGFSISNDVLLSHKGTVGLVARTPLTDSYVMLTPQVTYYRVNNSGNLLADFLEIFFRSNGFQTKLKSMAAQSTRAYIGITAQKKLSVPLPPKNEQKIVIEIWKQLQKTKKQLIENKNACLRLGNNLING